MAITGKDTAGGAASKRIAVPGDNTLTRNVLDHGSTPPPDWEAIAVAALREDRAEQDVTTALLRDAADRAARAVFRSDERCVIAGLPVLLPVFRALDPGATCSMSAEDGDWVESGQVLATVRATVRSLLGGERAALNVAQRLSGVATATRQVVEAVAHTNARIVDTRKTTPGLRSLEKYAVRVGGGGNHRSSLADMILWKDNHWRILDAVGRDLAAAFAGADRDLPSMVEVETDEQLDTALAAGVTHLLVDNQSPEQLARWIARAGPSVTIEASGGITKDTARLFAEAGAHRISIGALTHSSPAASLGMDIELEI